MEVWWYNISIRLALSGRRLNAAADSYYSELTFEDVSKGLYSSLLEDREIMVGSKIVEMR